MKMKVAPGRFRLASPVAALVLGGLVLVLMVALVPLGELSHQGLSTSGGSAFLAPVFGVVGFVVAWRRPGNPLGWLMLGAAGFLVLSGDAGAYAVADYRLHHGRLPFGWVAVLLQPGWAPAIAFFGLAVLLFPDGRVPSPRWRWVLWVYVAVAGAWVAGVIYISAGAIIGHNVHVAATGDLVLLDRPTGSSAWWGAVQAVFFPLLGVFWLVTLDRQPPVIEGCTHCHVPYTSPLSIFFEDASSYIIDCYKPRFRMASEPNLTYFTCTLGQAAERNRDRPRDFATVAEFIDVQARVHPDRPAIGFPITTSDSSYDWGYNVFCKF